MLSLDDRQRRELWGLALALLALLLALSLVPVGILGALGDRFAAGNIVGVVGSALRESTAGFLGVGALALPLLAVIWAGFAFHKLDLGTALRWTILLVSLAAIIPAALALMRGTQGIPDHVAGWLGAAFSQLLVSGVSAVGAAIVLFFLFAAACVATVGWNPLRTAIHGGRFAM